MRLPTAGTRAQGAIGEAIARVFNKAKAPTPVFKGLPKEGDTVSETENIGGSPLLADPEVPVPEVVKRSALPVIGGIAGATVGSLVPGGTIPGEMIGAALGEYANQVLSEIDRTIEYLNADYDEFSLSDETPIVLTGKFAEDPLVVNMIENSVPNPVARFGSQFESPAEFPESEFAANLGLCDIANL